MMTASEIRVHYDDLETIAIRFDHRGELTQQLLKDLRRQQGVLEDGVWLGSGAQAFFAEMNSRVVPTMNGLIQAFGEAAGTARQVHELLHQAEAEAAALFRGDGATLPTGDRSAGGAGDSDGPQSAKGGNAAPGTATVSGGTPFARGAGDADDISPNDVAQGQIGDCFLMASLAAIARSNPDVIRNMIKDNGDGSYTVTFKINVGGVHSLAAQRYEDDMKARGLDFILARQNLYSPSPDTFITKEIRVTPDFPANSSGGPLYAQYGDTAGGKPEMWVPLIEKAYAQMMGDYSDIKDGGQPWVAMRNITGKRSMTFQPEDIKMDELADYHAKGNAIVVHTPNHQTFTSMWAKASGRYDMVPNHAYYVTNVDKAAGTVSLRNPWGWHEKEITMPLNEFGGVFIKGAMTPTR
jgi:WXG100 family type VII secretion target